MEYPRNHHVFSQIKKQSNMAGTLLFLLWAVGKICVREGVARTGIRADPPAQIMLQQELRR
jgi:hypothetical protein